MDPPLSSNQSIFYLYHIQELSTVNFNNFIHKQLVIMNDLQPCSFVQDQKELNQRFGFM